MITRAQMRRQLRAKGGIMNVAPREKFGAGSYIKKKIRNLIPNELADIAVKSAPFIAPFFPGYAAIARGIGRFDQRGSISDALKQGALTYGFGKGVGKLGGASGSELGNVFGRQQYSMEGFKDRGLGRLFQEKQGVLKEDQMKRKRLTDLKNQKSIENTPDFMKKATESTIGKVPGLKKLPPMVQQKLLVGGITSGASALYSYFTGEFEPQQPGESMEEYMARRNTSVKQKMKGYMDSYYTPLRNPQYAAMSDEEKNNYIDSIVGQGMATGGRVGYQTGGITMANTLAENIRRNTANQAAVAQQFQKARKNIPQRTPVQEYAMSDDSILGPLSKKAASTIMAGQDKSQAALDMLNQTMAPTSAGEAGGIITDGPNKYRINADGSKTMIGSIGEGIMTQAPTNVNKQPTQDPRAGIKEAFFNERLSGGERFGDAIPDYDRYGTYTGSDQLIKDYAAAGLGTPTANFVKLPEGNPYAVSGPGYYSYDGTNFSKQADLNMTPEYEKFIRSNYNLNQINQNTVPRAITQDDIDTFNFTQSDPMITGFDYSKEINWSPGQPAPDGYRVAEIMGDKFLERKFPSKQEVARLPMALMGPGMMPPLNAPEDPDAGLSGQQIAEKYGIPYASGGRVGFSDGSNLKIKLKQIGYEDTLLDTMSIKELRELLDSEKGTFTDQGTYREPANMGGIMGMPMGEPRVNQGGITELDYRAKGGFVPVGIKEKADDVPAMLSKNEFVFTADAVRGAGNGSVEKGAQKMYDTMKNLERRVT